MVETELWRDKDESYLANRFWIETDVTTELVEPLRSAARILRRIVRECSLQSRDPAELRRSMRLFRKRREDDAVLCKSICDPSQDNCNDSELVPRDNMIRLDCDRRNPPRRDEECGICSISLAMLSNDRQLSIKLSILDALVSKFRVPCDRLNEERRMPVLRLVSNISDAKLSSEWQLSIITRFSSLRDLTKERCPLHRVRDRLRQAAAGRGGATKSCNPMEPRRGVVPSSDMRRWLLLCAQELNWMKGTSNVVGITKRYYKWAG